VNASIAGLQLHVFETLVEYEPVECFAVSRAGLSALHHQDRAGHRAQEGDQLPSTPALELRAGHPAVGNPAVMTVWSCSELSAASG